MRKLYALLLLSCISCTAFSQNDSLTRCIQNGFITSVNSAIVDASGNVFIGGYYANDSTVIRSFISKINPQGDLVFNNRVNPNNRLVSLVDKVVATLDGNLLYLGFHFECDVGPYVYYMEKCDQLGQLVWSKQLGESAVFIKEDADSSFYILRYNNLVHYAVNGDSLSSLTLPGSYITGGIALGNYYLLQNSYDSLEIVDSNAILINKIRFNYVNCLLLATNDSIFYVADDTSVFKLNSNLQILNQNTLPGLYNNPIDLKIINNEVWIIKRTTPQLYKFDLNLNLLAVVDFSNTMDSSIHVERVLEKDSASFYALCNESNHVLLKSINNTNYTTHAGYMDASIYNSRCDSTKGHFFTSGSGALSSYLEGRFFVTVKNTGTLAWDSIWVNAYLNRYSNTCAPTTFSKKFVRTIQPGDTAEFFVGWLQKYILYTITNQLSICFYASSPNYLQDYQHSNDSLCSAFTISNIVSVQEESSTLDVQLYPNPADAELTVSINNFNNTGGRIDIYDLYGTLVLSKKISANKSKIETTFLKSGIYFYALCERDIQIKKGKLLIQH